MIFIFWVDCSRLIFWGKGKFKAENLGWLKTCPPKVLVIGKIHFDA